MYFFILLLLLLLLFFNYLKISLLCVIFIACFRQIDAELDFWRADLTLDAVDWNSWEDSFPWLWTLSDLVVQVRIIETTNFNITTIFNITLILT